MARHLHSLVVAVLLISAYSFSQTLGQHADRIFVNGKIWTEEDSQKQAQALAVSADKIIAVGNNQQIKALASRDTAAIVMHNRSSTQKTTS